MNATTRYRLRGSHIRSLQEAYDEMAREMTFPHWFGESLDAVWDILSTEISGPFEIIWEDAARSRAHMGLDYMRLVKLFRDLEKERDDFRFILA